MNPNDWENSEWYKEWKRLAKAEQKEEKLGRWICYVDEKGEIHYEYEEPKS